MVYLSDYNSGMYRSTDTGLSWTKINTDLTTRSVTGLAISSDGLHLYTASHGGGVFRLDINGEAPSDVNSSIEPPLVFELGQNYPNPFNAATTIPFTLFRPSSVRLWIFDLLGHEITTLIEERYPAGDHRFTWTATGLSSGIYLYRLETGGFTLTRKLIIQK